MHLYPRRSTARERGWQLPEWMRYRPLDPLPGPQKARDQGHPRLDKPFSRSGPPAGRVCSQLVKPPKTGPFSSFCCIIGVKQFTTQIEDDAVELPSIPVQRSSAVAGRDRIQPGQPVAAAGAAEGNRNVVINQFAAAAGENRRAAGKACPLLLAIAGGEPSHASLVRKHAAADGGFAAVGRVGAAARRNQSGRRRGVEGGVSEKSLRNRANHGLLVLEKAVRRTTGALALEPMQKERERRRMGVYWLPAERQNGNSG